VDGGDVATWQSVASPREAGSLCGVLLEGKAPLSSMIQHTMSYIASVFWGFVGERRDCSKKVP
jgi:hypothetical protein